MAGDWLKIEVNLPEKPEVWQIAGITGLDPDAVVGKLLKVWRWFDAHTQSGNAPGVTYALVDSLVSVTGFAEAMVFAGWLEQQGRDLSLPHFDRHNGKTAKNRGVTAKRVAAFKEKSNAAANGQVTPTPLPREEKKREEEKQDQKKEQGADAPTPPKKVTKRAEQTFTGWADSLDGDAIPPTDPVFAYAAKAGLPGDYVPLAWAWFEAEYGEDGPRAAKKYADWRAVFRKVVSGNWGKLWAVNRQGEFYLTTEGVQAQRALA